MKEPLVIKTYDAEAAITKYRIVKFGTSTKQVITASANTDNLVGVNEAITVDADERVDVIRAGFAEVEYGGTITKGDYLTADASGKAVKLTDVMLASGACQSIGVAEDSGVSGDIGSLFVYPQKVSKFDAVTSSAAELNLLDGTVAGTAVASKAVALDANKALDEINTAKLSIGTSGSEVEVTATPAELNVLHSVTAGTAAASSGVVLDANKAVDEINTAKLSIGASGSEVEVTATPAELNLLDISAHTETIDSGDAVSITKRVTKIDNTVSGAGAITLAAPNATMLGQVKVIEMTVDGGDVTLALTNVDGGTATTTATFANVGEALTLVGGVSKWHVLGEAGVTLS